MPIPQKIVSVSDLKAEMQAEIKTYQEKIAAKDEQLERVLTSVQRDRSDLIADKFAVLKRELKMLQKQSLYLEEKLEDLEREIEGKEKGISWNEFKDKNFLFSSSL